VPQELEARISEQMLDVASRTGEEVVDTEHLGSISQQALAEVRAEKPGATGDKDSVNDAGSHDFPSPPV
jgi:hypothetical protein